MARVWLRDDQFARIAVLLSGKAGDPGRTAADNRLFLEAVLSIARTGTPGRDLPPEFGLWNSVYQRFARWSRRGVWHQVFAQLADKAYDTDAILGHRASNGIDAVIPPRSHRLVERPFDQHHYQNRNLIERFVCRIKQFRRIATRYDKLAERFASFVALTAAVIGLA